MDHDAGTELVALYDDAGRPCGVSPRWRVRALNLRHAATAVVVRNVSGDVYVHRRTWQPEEVAWGAWVTPRRLAAMLDEVAFVPDSVALLGRWLTALRAGKG